MQDLRGISSIGQVRVEGADPSGLASWVLAVLAQRRETSRGAVRPAVLASLFAAIVADDLVPLTQFLRDLPRQKITAEALADEYVPAAARMLGDKWIDDDISFTAVTVGSARLQYIVRCIGTAWQADEFKTGRSSTVLLLTPAGEQHTLGALVLMGRIRRLGVSVALVFGASSTDIGHKAVLDDFDGVMVSCSSLSLLPEVAAIVGTLRKRSQRHVPVIIGGQVAVLREQVMQVTGADEVTNELMVAFRVFGLPMTIENVKMRA